MKGSGGSLVKRKPKRKPNLTVMQLLYVHHLVRCPGKTVVPDGIAQALVRKGWATPYIVYSQGAYLRKYQASEKAVKLVRALSA